MAERRMIAKSISTSLKVARTKGMGPKLLFTWLIPHADDEGRLQGDPILVKGQILPLVEEATIKTIPLWLQDLHNNQLINWYSVNGEKYIQINKFEEINKTRNERFKKSKYPDVSQMSDNCQTNDSTMLDKCQSNLTEQNLTKQNRTEQILSPISHVRKRTFGEIVELYPAQYEKLISIFGQDKTLELIENANSYFSQIGIKATQKRYKSHYHAILNWDRRDKKEIERRIQVREATEKKKQEDLA